MTTTERPREFKVVGTRPIRHDGIDKVLGRAIYGADITMTGLLHGAVLRSPYAHARIERIDTSKAEAAPGVLAVMTSDDMPLADETLLDLGEEMTNAKWASERVMARGKAIYRGHPVAAIAAVDLNTALEALKLIDIEYEVLKPVISLADAMAPDATIIHDDLVGDHLGERVEHTNIAEHRRIEFGDPSGRRQKGTKCYVRIIGDLWRSRGSVPTRDRRWRGSLARGTSLSRPCDPQER